MKSRSKSFVFFLIFLFLSIAINAFILINAFIPGDESSVTSFWVADILATVINFLRSNTINSGNIDSFTYVVRKVVGHFGLFLFDGLFVGITFYLFDSLKKKLNFWLSTLLIFLTGAFVASASEMIQVFIPGRVGSLTDVLIDMSGYLLAFVIIFLIFFIRQFKKEQTKK